MTRLRPTMAITIGAWMMTVAVASAQVGAPPDPPAQAAAPAKPRPVPASVASSPLLPAVLTPAGGYVSGTNLIADTDSVNAGAFSPGFIFGGVNSGESIASRRTAGAGQFGINVFTNFTPRLTIANGGFVGVGTVDPAVQLHVNAPDFGYGFLIEQAGVQMGTYLDSGSGQFGTKSNHKMLFFTNDNANSALAIDTTNFVGVGAASPVDRLHVRENLGGARVRIEATETAFAGTLSMNGERGYFTGVDPNNPLVAHSWEVVDNTALEARLTITPAGLVDIPGSLTVHGTFSNPSDARLKEQITSLPYGLREVLQLRPVTWRWKDRRDSKTGLGLIAQEVEPIIPELVERGPDRDETLSLSYVSLVPVLIRAIQEQQTALDRKDQVMTALRTENADLVARVAQIERALEQLTALGRR